MLQKATVRKIDQFRGYTPSAINCIAIAIASTPCPHYQRYVGICAFCWLKYLASEESVQAFVVK